MFSNDCGVFVATWMKECGWLDYYDCVEVRPVLILFFCELFFSYVKQT